MEYFCDSYGTESHGLIIKKKTHCIIPMYKNNSEIVKMTRKIILYKKKTIRFYNVEHYTHEYVSVCDRQTAQYIPISREE